MARESLAVIIRLGGPSAIPTSTPQLERQASQQSRSMSVDLQVALDPSRMPDPAAWATAVRSAGFEADLDIDFDPETFSGFLPCQYKGKPAGFEYYRGTLDPKEQTNLGLSASQSCVVTFSTRSNYREFATSMICAAVLASSSDGVLIDADGVTAIPRGSEIDWARDGEQSIQDDIRLQDLQAPSTQVAVPAQVSPKPWWKFW